MRAFIAALLLSSAAAAAQTSTPPPIGTPAASVTMAADGISLPLPILATQSGETLTVMVAAPSGGTLEVDAAPTWGGPWFPIGTVETLQSGGYIANTGVLQVPGAGYSFTTPYVPFLRLNVVSLTGGTATLAVAQPVTH